MEFKIRAAFQPDPNVLENTLEILETSYETQEAALNYIKANLELRGLTEDQSQVVLVVNGKDYIYFEIVSNIF